jgi:hypothetical protein
MDEQKINGRRVFIQRDLNFINRLTITPARITIKLVKTDREQDDKVINFFLTIADVFMGYPRALRGFLGQDHDLILRDNQHNIIKKIKYN